MEMLSTRQDLVTLNTSTMRQIYFAGNCMNYKLNIVVTLNMLFLNMLFLNMHFLNMLLIYLLEHVKYICVTALPFNTGVFVPILDQNRKNVRK